MARRSFPRPIPHPSKAARRPGRRGLTLIELLVAMALLATLLTLVYTSFFQISEGALSQKRLLSGRQEARLLFRLVADDLLSARFLDRLAVARKPSGLAASTENYPGGSFSNLQFHSEAPTRLQRQWGEEKDPGLHEVGYRVRQTPQGGLELWRREDFYLDDSLEQGGTEVRVARRVKSFLVEFLEPLAPGATQERWVREWNSNQRASTQRMPAAFKITLGLETGQGEAWEETQEYNLYE